MKGFVIAAVSALFAAHGVAAGAHHKRVVHYDSRITWFHPPTGNDACGGPVPENASVVHVSHERWNNGENCGQWMSITCNGKQEYGVVTGYCDGCSADQIDTSPILFSQFDHTDTGILSGSWKFMKKGWTPPDMEECE